MANVPESLGKYIPWDGLLRRLGVTVTTAALPAAVDCPLCHAKGALSVRPDPALGSTWYRCRAPDCDFAGDGWMLHVHADADRDAVPGIAALAADGIWTGPIPFVLRAAALALRAHCRRWAVAREWGYGERATSGVAGNLLRLRYAVAGDRMPRGVARLLRSEVDAEFGDPRRFAAAWRRGRPAACPGPGDQLRLGRGTRDFLSLAYEDLPGRVCGLALATGDGDYPRCWSQLRLLRIPGCRRDPANDEWTRDAGLFNLTDVLDRPTHPAFGTAVLACHRPDWALALLTADARDGDPEHPLPVVAAWAGRTYRTAASWGLLAGRDVVHVVDRYDADAIRAARRTGGRLVLVPPGAAFADFARPPYRLVRDAVTWVDAVSCVLDEAPDDEARALITALGLDDAGLADLRARLDVVARGRLVGLLRANAAAGRSVPSRNKHYRVTERDGAWWLGTGRLLSDAIIRVDRHVYWPAFDRDPGTGKATDAIEYRGRVLFGGAEYPFAVPANDPKFCRATMEWLRLFVGRHSSRLVRGYHPWRGSLVDVALGLQAPQSVVVPPFVGPDRDAGGLVFPRFRLRADGTAEPLPVPVTERDPGVPFADAAVPGPADREEAASLPDAALALVGLHAAALLVRDDPAGYAREYRRCATSLPRDAAAGLLAAATGGRGEGPRRTRDRFPWPGVANFGDAMPLGIHASRVAGACDGLAGAHVLEAWPAASVEPAALRRALVAFLQECLQVRVNFYRGRSGCRVCDSIRHAFQWARGEATRVSGLVACPRDGSNLALALRVALAAGVARVDSGASLRTHSDRSLYRDGGRVHLPTAVFGRLAAQDHARALPAASVARAVIAAGGDGAIDHVGDRVPGYWIPGDWFDDNVISKIHAEGD